MEVRPDACGQASLPFLSLRGACDEAIHATTCRSDTVSRQMGRNRLAKRPAATRLCMDRRAGKLHRLAMTILSPGRQSRTARIDVHGGRPGRVGASVATVTCR